MKYKNKKAQTEVCILPDSCRDNYIFYWSSVYMWGGPLIEKKLERVKTKKQPSSQMEQIDNEISNILLNAGRQI